MAAKYEFTNTWFDTAAREVWNQLIPQLKPTRILEVGAYEGAATCYLIEQIGAASDVELHCIDTWEGGVEHQAGGVSRTDMSAVERRFHHNTQVAGGKIRKAANLCVHKGRSDVALATLLAQGKAGYFDFIYIDGSHQAPDVLCDAVLAFRLLRTDGIIAFDDYLWHEHETPYTDPIRCPKPAIDAFTNLYCRKLNVLSAPLYQLYVQKVSD